MRHKIGIYCRSATKEQAGSLFSKQIEAQEERLVGLVEQMNRTNAGWGEVTEVYRDDGFSGLRMDRPGLSKLRHDVRHGIIDLVLVTESSRLSRSIRFHLDLIEEFSRHGADVLVADKFQQDSILPDRTETSVLNVVGLFAPSMIRGSNEI